MDLLVGVIFVDVLEALVASFFMPWILSVKRLCWAIEVLKLACWWFIKLVLGVGFGDLG